MAIKKTPAKKTSKARASSKKGQPRYGKFGWFSKFQMLIFASIFAIAGGTLYLYRSNAAGDTWSAYLSTYPKCNAPYGIPPTIVEGNNGPCTRMLKAIIVQKMPAYVSQYIPAVDIYFGSGLTSAVKKIKTDFKVYNKFGAIDGYVDTNTWLVVRYIVLHGYYPKAYQPPPPPITGYGVKPSSSGKLTGTDKANFDANYNAYYATGWCIVRHETNNNPANQLSSYSAFYGAIQSSGVGPATGAFQIQGGYPNRDIPPATPDSVGNNFGPGNSNTWGNFYGYQYAAVAPADVQWAMLFRLINVRPSPWSGTGCPGT